ncbi:MAG: hypothetical protein M3153_09145 [Chloroflexota bacterium]|nr:hypothetical protein [Chloroflexota bacterium]
MLHAELVDPDWLWKVLDAVFAEIGQGNIYCQGETCLPRQDHLAAMRGGGDARCLVDVEAEIVAISRDRPPSVDPHPHPEWSVGECVLGLGSRTHGPGRTREHGEDGIALRIHLNAVMGRERVAQDAAVRRQRLGIDSRAELVEELG